MNSFRISISFSFNWVKYRFFAFDSKCSEKTNVQAKTRFAGNNNSLDSLLAPFSLLADRHFQRSVFIFNVFSSLSLSVAKWSGEWVRTQRTWYVRWWKLSLFNANWIEISFMCERGERSIESKTRTFAGHCSEDDEKKAGYSLTSFRLAHYNKRFLWIVLIFQLAVSIIYGKVYRYDAGPSIAHVRYMMIFMISQFRFSLTFYLQPEPVPQFSRIFDFWSFFISRQFHSTELFI